MVQNFVDISAQFEAYKSLTASVMIVLKLKLLCLREKILGKGWKKRACSASDTGNRELKSRVSKDIQTRSALEEAEIKEITVSFLQK